MSTKQKAVIVCDYCSKEIDTTAPYIITRSVQNEGCSTIESTCRGSTPYDVDDKDFCDLPCLYADISTPIMTGEKKDG